MTKNDHLPYNFDLGSSDSKLVVFYGKDLAMQMSLSRRVESDFYSESALKDNLQILYSTSLFEDEKPIRAMVSAKLAEQLIQKHDLNEFERRCILIVDSAAIKAKSAKVDYVKCDELNQRTRKLFIKFWNKILATDLSVELEINNLDEFKFAHLKQGLSLDPDCMHAEDEYSVWNKIRGEQFKNKKFYQGIFRHFELWARNNAPNDETLQMCLNRVKQELDLFKQTSN